VKKACIVCCTLAGVFGVLDKTGSLFGTNMLFGEAESSKSTTSEFEIRWFVWVNSYRLSSSFYVSSSILSKSVEVVGKLKSKLNSRRVLCAD
jgi:hypothetical protein